MLLCDFCLINYYSFSVRGPRPVAGAGSRLQFVDGSATTMPVDEASGISGGAAAGRCCLPAVVLRIQWAASSFL